MHARLGELLYISSEQSDNGDDVDVLKVLNNAVLRYCRSIELCDGYLRGYYGLKIVSQRGRSLYPTLLGLTLQTTDRILSISSSNTSGAIALDSIRQLNRMAVANMISITTQPRGGYDESEIIAAKALLDADRKK